MTWFKSNRRPKERWIVFFWIFVLSACQGQSIPMSMVQTWETDHPRYEDCYLLISPSHVSFIDANINTNECSITRVLTVKKDQGLSVPIDLVNSQKVSSSIQLIYSSENGGQLSFKNQPDVVWKPVK